MQRGAFSSRQKIGSPKLSGFTPWTFEVHMSVTNLISWLVMLNHQVLKPKWVVSFMTTVTRQDDTHRLLTHVPFHRTIRFAHVFFLSAKV